MFLLIPTLIYDYNDKAMVSTIRSPLSQTKTGIPRICVLLVRVEYLSKEDNCTLLSPTEMSLFSHLQPFIEKK